MPRLLFEYAKLLRLPGLGGLSLAPIFGALSLMDLGVNITLTDITLLFLIGVFAASYSFVSNDIIDVEVDRLSKEPEKRPLVTGTISKRIAVIISFICVIGAFLITVIFYRYNTSFNYGILCLILAAIFGTIYNVYGKKFASSAFLAALSEGLLVLVGAFLISPNGSLSIFTWIFAILMFTQILFMTAVLGGVKDADHDFLTNAKTIALAMKVKYEGKKIKITNSFKAFSLSIRLLSAILVFVPFVFFEADYHLWQILLLVLFVIIVLSSTIKLLNIKTVEKRDEIIKLAGAQGILRYCFIPIMLISLIGPIYALLLIVFPLIWYIIFTPFSGKKLFKQVM